MWYGLTMDEATSRCASLGLRIAYEVTMDPKAKASGADHAGPGDTSADMAGAGQSGVMKVIRAREEAGAMILLFGCFARETGDASDDGD